MFNIDLDALPSYLFDLIIYHIIVGLQLKNSLNLFSTLVNCLLHLVAALVNTINDLSVKFLSFG